MGTLTWVGRHSREVAAILTGLPGPGASPEPGPWLPRGPDLLWTREGMLLVTCARRAPGLPDSAFTCGLLFF